MGPSERITSQKQGQPGSSHKEGLVNRVRFARSLLQAPLQRAGLALALAATLGAMALPAAPSAGAASEPQPRARLWLYIQRVHIFNDHDGWATGAGDFSFRFTLERRVPGALADTVEFARKFDASTGETEFIRQGTLEPLPVYAGDTVLARICGFEYDSGAFFTSHGTHVGCLEAGSFGEPQNWGIGFHTLQNANYHVAFDILPERPGAPDAPSGSGGSGSGSSGHPPTHQH